MSATMHEFTCDRCGHKGGSTDATVTRCFNCREQAEWEAAGTPLCEVTDCDQHIGPKAAVNGYGKCRRHYQVEFETSVHEEYRPVLELVEDFTEFPGEVQNTGGNCMVAYVSLYWLDESRCTECSQPIKVDGSGDYVHSDTGVTPCDPANPDKRDWLGHPAVATYPVDYPRVGITYDTDDTWTITLERWWDDEDGSQGLDTADLPSGADDTGRVIYGGKFATAEDVAARVILLIENPEYGRTPDFAPRRDEYQQFLVDVHVDADWLASQPPRGSGPLDASIYQVVSGGTAALFADPYETRRDTGWKVSSFGPRQVLGEGWFVLSVGAASLAGDVTIGQVVARLADRCPHFTVIREHR